MPDASSNCLPTYQCYYYTATIFTSSLRTEQKQQIELYPTLIQRISEELNKSLLIVLVFVLDLWKIEMHNLFPGNGVFRVFSKKSGNSYAMDCRTISRGR